MNRRTQKQNSKAPNYGHLVYLLEGRWGVRWQGWCNKMISPQPWQPPCIGYFDNILVLLFTTRSNFCLLITCYLRSRTKDLLSPTFLLFLMTRSKSNEPILISQIFHSDSQLASLMALHAGERPQPAREKMQIKVYIQTQTQIQTQIQIQIQRRTITSRHSTVCGLTSWLGGRRCETERFFGDSRATRRADRRPTTHLGRQE